MGLKVNTRTVPKKQPKLSPKGTPTVSQNHQNGLQKPSQKGAPKKRRQIVIFSTPECGQSEINMCKIDDFNVLVLTPSWVSFWKCFGSPNGGLNLQKATSKKQQQQQQQQMIPKMDPDCSPRVSQSGAKIVKNEVLEAPCFEGGSQVASRALQDRFWTGFGNIFVSCSNICLMICGCIP